MIGPERGIKGPARRSIKLWARNKKSLPRHSRDAKIIVYHQGVPARARANGPATLQSVLILKQTGPDQQTLVTGNCQFNSYMVTLKDCLEARMHTGGPGRQRRGQRGI